MTEINYLYKDFFLYFFNSMHRQLQILVTNDDSYLSKGIQTVSEILSVYGDVTVVAPKEVQSGMSAALTLTRPLRLAKESEQICSNGNSIKVFSFTGTPADCVKIAMNEFFFHRKPDILVSGINHGSNASVASVYSGTLGATAEGTIYGVPSMGISIDTHDPDADFAGVKKYLPKIIENFLSNPPQKGVYLNINFPDAGVEAIKGMRFAKQGDGMWIKEFDKRTDPHGREYYWMTGHFLDTETDLSGDHKVVADGYISIVPHNIDTTNYREIERLGTCWEL